MTEPIDDTSTGKLMAGVLAAFAQFDNDVRSERTRAGMRMAHEQGRWMFIPPVRYLNAPKWTGKSLMPDPDCAALATSAFEEPLVVSRKRKSSAASVAADSERAPVRS